MKYHEQLKLRKNHISKRNNKNDDASIKEVIDQWFLIFKLALGVGFVVFGLFLFSLFKKYHFFIGSSDISSSSGGFFALMLGGSLILASLSMFSAILGLSILAILGSMHHSYKSKKWHFFIVMIFYVIVCLITLLCLFKLSSSNIFFIVWGCFCLLMFCVDTHYKFSVVCVEDINVSKNYHTFSST